MSIRVEPKEKYLLLRSDALDLTEAEANELIASYEKGMGPRTLLVIDLSLVQEITPGALRALTRMAGQIKPGSSKVALVVPENINTMITSQGLLKLFEVHATLTSALGRHRTVGTPREQAQEFLHMITNSVVYTLQICASTEVKPAKATTAGPKSESPVPVVDIGALIMISSASFKGVLTVAFPMPTYLKTMSKFLSQEFVEFNDEIRDGAAEILNMVMGQSRTSLNALGYKLSSGIPSLIRNTEKAPIFSAKNAPSVIVPFESELGTFFVELTPLMLGGRTVSVGTDFSDLVS